MKPTHDASRIGAKAARYVSTALAVVAMVTCSLSFTFWEAFHRDVPMGIGNMRGTALTLLILGVPLLAASMVLSARGSARTRKIRLDR